MGLFDNFTVFTAMIVPLFLMLRGHQIQAAKLWLLGVVVIVVQLLTSTAAAAATGAGGGGGAVAAAVLPAVALVAFLSEAVRADSKVSRALAAAAVETHDCVASGATLWCLCEVIFLRWTPWYQSLSALGISPTSVASGFDALATLVLALAAGRLLQRGAALGAVLGGAVALPAVGTVALARLALSGAGGGEEHGVPAFLVPVVARVLQAALCLGWLLVTPGKRQPRAHGGEDEEHGGRTKK